MTLFTDMGPCDPLKEAIRIYNIKKEERSPQEQAFLEQFIRLNPLFEQAIKADVRQDDDDGDVVVRVPEKVLQSSPRQKVETKVMDLDCVPIEE